MPREDSYEDEEQNGYVGRDQVSEQDVGDEGYNASFEQAPHSLSSSPAMPTDDGFPSSPSSPLPVPVGHTELEIILVNKDALTAYLDKINARTSNLEEHNRHLDRRVRDTNVALDTMDITFDNVREDTERQTQEFKRAFQGHLTRERKESSSRIQAIKLQRCELECGVDGSV